MILIMLINGKTEIKTENREILLVDDETSFIRSLADGLEMAGERFHVTTAENGKQAVELLKKLRFNLIITDLNMPVMDGFELLDYIKREQPGARVMVMSMLNYEDVCGRLKELGGAQFIEKPVDFYTVLNRILAV